MELDTESGNRFFSHDGRDIDHLEKHQGLAMEFHYEDTETGRQFDVRELPAEYLKELRDRVLKGDRKAHREAIIRAIDDDFHFVVNRT